MQEEKQTNSITNAEAIEWLQKEISLTQPLIDAINAGDWEKYGFILPHRREPIFKAFNVKKHLLNVLTA